MQRSHLVSLLATTLALSTSCGKGNSKTTDTGSTAGSTAGDPPVTPEATMVPPGSIAFHMTAGGFASKAAGASLLGSLSSGLNLTVNSPTGDEYAGMGVNFGPAVVDGFKIRLTQIILGQANPDHAGGGKQSTVLDWSSAPKELQIANGFSGVVDDTAMLALPEGTYDTLTAQYKDNYDLKAYAYLDQNNDGTVDATIYTTKDAIVLAAGQVIAPTALAALGYDYHHYAYTNLNSHSIEHGPTAVDNGDTLGGLTMFKDPLVVTADTKEISVSLIVAIDRLARVWDGRFGDNHPLVIGDGHVPPPGLPFPVALNDSRTGNVLARFPVGQPAFALDYLPLFGFVNTPTLKSEAYMVSMDSNFIGYNSQTFIVVYDEAQKPLIGHILINDSSTSPHLGQTAKGFAKQADNSYTFYSEYGIKDAAGVDDGGYFYSSDTAKAGFVLSGFKPLAAVGDSAPITVTDGPRCKAEYNYCVASSPNNLGVPQNPAGTRTLYVKRLR